jgi:hypothetical protein
MRKRAAAAVLSGLLLMTGCTGDAQDGAESPGGGETRGGNATGDNGETSTVSFGEPHQFDDGVVIRVGEPQQFRPSEGATTGGEPDYVRLRVRLTNGTEKRMSTDQVSVTVESGDGQAGDVIDERKGLTGPPSQVVRPGETATWALGFGVLDPEDVTVDVQVGMERDPVAFGG